MHINFKKGKTEAIVTFRGAGSVACRAALHATRNESGDILFPVIVSDKNIFLNIVDTYKREILRSPYSKEQVTQVR